MKLFQLATALRLDSIHGEIDLTVLYWVLSLVIGECADLAELGEEF